MAKSKFAKTERNESIFKDRENGITFREIAEKHGISMGRVREITQTIAKKKRMEEIKSQRSK